MSETVRSVRWEREVRGKGNHSSFAKDEEVLYFAYVNDGFCSIAGALVAKVGCDYYIAPGDIKRVRERRGPFKRLKDAKVALLTMYQLNAIPEEWQS